MKYHNDPVMSNVGDLVDPALPIDWDMEAGMNGWISGGLPGWGMIALSPSVVISGPYFYPHLCLSECITIENPEDAVYDQMSPRGAF